MHAALSAGHYVNLPVDTVFMWLEKKSKLETKKQGKHDAKKERDKKTKRETRVRETDMTRGRGYVAVPFTWD